MMKLLIVLVFMPLIKDGISQCRQCG